MNIVSNKIPIELCKIIQSYQADFIISKKIKVFKKIHKDIKVAYDRLNFYQELIKDKPNKIEWVCRLIHINQVLFKNDTIAPPIWHHHY